MPCFLFTYHGYGTWLPNRSRGYVKRGQGILPPDEHMHRLYTESMTETIVCFNGEIQLELIRAALEAAPHQRFEPYYIATDSSHLHVLLGWRHSKRSVLLRSQLKWSLTRALNLKYEHRKWLADKGNCKQVKDRQHFDYLRNVYLPKHNGWKWQPERGLFK